MLSNCLILVCGIFVLLGISPIAEAADIDCGSFNITCQACVEHTECFYCTSKNTCYHNNLYSWYKECTLASARWKYCWLNVEALIISCSVLGGIVLILLCCACCYCNRKMKQRRQRKMAQEEAVQETHDAERRERNEQRRGQHEAQRDEIRKKYGLPLKAEASYKKLQEEE